MSFNTPNPNDLSPETLARLHQQAQQHGLSLDAMLNRLLDEGTRLLVDNLSDLVTIHTLQGYYVYITSSCTKVLGYMPNDLLGKRAVDIVHPDDIPIMRRAHKELMLTGTSRMEYRAIHKNGQYIWFDTVNQLIYDPLTQQPTKIIALSRDITQQKLIEQSLRQSEQKYRQFFNEVPIALRRQDFSLLRRYLLGLVEGGIDDLETYLRENPAIMRGCLHLARILDANPLALALFGVDTVQDMQAQFEHIVDISPTQAASLAAIARGDLSFTGEFLNRPNTHGNEAHILLKWLVMQGHEDTFSEVIVASIDITDQKRYQASLLENDRLVAQFRAEQAHNSLIQRSIAALSHDLRTPLAVIATSKDLLLRHFDKLTEEKRKEKLESIGRQLEFALELLNDTVMTVRGTLSDRPFRPALIDLPRLCQVVLDEIADSYHANHRLRFANLDAVGMVLVDEVLVSRILLNLISNALKYSPPNTDVRLELTQEETHVIFRVIDEGIGIAPQDLPHIFEPFFRADSVSGILGTGLGLSIVYECVQQHGGTIDVQSTIGQGTRVTVRLPV